MAPEADYSRFSLARLSQRKLAELLGLCHGLIANGRLDLGEAEALHAWLITQREFAHPSIRSLQIRIDQMLEDQKLDENENAELIELVRSLIFNYPDFEWTNAPSSDHNMIGDTHVSTLLGLCRGLIADGELDEKEATTLEDWLILSRGFMNNPCFDAVLERLKNHKRTEGLSDSELGQLLQLLSGIVGGRTEVGECLRTSELWLDDPFPEVVFADRVFCFTGRFTYGSRNKCENAVRSRGGTCSNTPTRKTNYLVIGSYAEESWTHSSFGRKIEKAVRMRDKGQGLKIISESHWKSSFESPEYDMSHCG